MGQGIAAGALAFGLPALANALIARRAARLPPAAAPLDPTWHNESWDAPVGRLAWSHGGPSDAESILLLHSLGPGHSSTQWLPAAEALAQHYHVVVLDHLGWGASDRPKGPYDINSCLHTLAAFAEHALPDGFHLAAAGESAAVALGLAGDHAAVRSLALSGPAGLRLAPPDQATPARRLSERGYDLLLAAPVLGTSAVNAYARRSSIENSLYRHLLDPPSDALIDEHYRLAHLPGTEHALSALLRGRFEAALDDFEISPELAVWIGWGRKAMGEPVEDADLWLGRLGHAELAVFENAASWPHVDQPLEFAEEYRRFLDGI